MKVRNRLRWIAVIGFLGLSLAWGSGCGRKAPPVAPNPSLTIALVASV